MLSEVEESMTKNFIEREIPETYQPIYRHLLKEGKDSTLEGKILAISDKVDLLYESFGEIQKGNPENILWKSIVRHLQPFMSTEKWRALSTF